MTGSIPKQKLNPVATGFPPSLHIVSALSALVQDAGKLTLWQWVVLTPTHAIEGVLSNPLIDKIKMPESLGYQSLLMNESHVTHSTSSCTEQCNASLPPVTGRAQPQL